MRIDDIDPSSSTDRRIPRILAWAVDHPRAVLVFGAALLIGLFTFLPRLEKDTSPEAFIPDDNPVLQYRDRVRQVFGLEDPMVVAVLRETEGGVFTPHGLRLVDWLTREVKRVPGVDPERVRSLATENDVVGTPDGFYVEPFFESPPATQAGADSVRSAVMDFPLYRGGLVSDDGRGTLIVAEILDAWQDRGDEVYASLRELADRAPTADEELHVAGEGAVSGYLSAYIDQDGRRLNVLAAVIISLVLLLAYRTLRGVLLPNLVVIGTLAGALGLMAAFDVSFSVMSNGMMVTLIGIAVADSIHIIGRYYEESARTPAADARDLVLRTIAAMWRPVTITSVTTAAGFLGIFASSYMPPMREFGLFAAVGVGMALIFSLVVVPAGLAMLEPRRSGAFHGGAQDAAAGAGAHADGFGAVMAGVGVRVRRHPRALLAAGAVVGLLGAFGASRVDVDYERIRNFRSTEPIARADRAINRHFDGTNYVDVVIETPEAEGLFEPDRLRRIAALQSFVDTLPRVGGSSSVADFIMQMNRGMHADSAAAYRIPDDPRLIAQYFLLYSASGDPTDFREIVDYDYRLANTRIRLNSGRYTDERRVMGSIRTYLDSAFTAGPTKPTLSGRVAVDYEWMRRLADNHVRSVILALLVVWLAACVTFRSLGAGTITVVPVVLSVLMIYAVMGFTGIWLGIGTSMFAAIALGVGIDFAVHTMDRLVDLVRERGRTVDEALADLYPSTGRALFFNFAAVTLGFGVLMTSAIPPVARFGGLVAVAVSASFVTSMTLLPALVKVVQPAFLRAEAPAGIAPRDLRAAARSLLLAAGLATAALIGRPTAAAAQDVATAAAPAGELPSGAEIARRINARDDGRSVVRDLRMELIAASGKKRVRETRALRKYYGGEKRTVLFYTDPPNIAGTAFLTWDYAEAGRDDDQWLYLPGLRRVRRIAASDRGDYFLGTDFTYEDIKLETKVSIEDYDRRTLGGDTIDGVPVYVVEAVPVDEETARELGYSRVVQYVDPEIWMIRRAEFQDVAGNRLKTVHAREIERVDGIWTPLVMEAVNHKTGHRTVFRFSDVDFEEPVDDDVFTRRALRRGLP